MKDIAYAQKNGSDLKLFLFDRQEEIAPSQSYKALMMSRLDFSVIVTDIPPVHPSEMGNLLAFKLRSLYPGDPDTTIFDYMVIAKNKQKYAVLFITSRDTMDKYKTMAGNKPLLLPFPAVHKLSKRYENDNCIFYFWHKDWVDVSIYEKGVFKTSAAIKREKETFLDFLKMRNILPKEYNEYRNIFICFRNESAFLQDQSRDLFKETKHVQFTPIEDTLSLFSQKNDYLFRKKQQAFLFYKKLRIEMLILPLVFLVCLLFNKYIETRAAYLVTLKKTFNERIQITRQIKEYEAKKAQLNELLEQKPADVFFFLSEISKIFRNEVKIRNFEFITKDKTIGVQGGGKKKVIKEYHFIIKGVTKAEILQYIEIFNKNPYFKNITIPNVTVDEFQMEGIFVKGVFDADR